MLRCARRPIGWPGDERQTTGCLLDPHERVHFQCQGDQQGGEEQQARAHEGQRVQPNETPSDPFCRGRVKLQGGRCD